MIPTKIHRIRALGVGAVLLVGMAALGYRLYDFQILRHHELSREVNRLHERHIKLSALRGMILDCNRNVLAHSVAVRTVVVDPQVVKDENARWMKAGQPSPSVELAKILS